MMELIETALQTDRRCQLLSARERIDIPNAKKLKMSFDVIFAEKIYHIVFDMSAVSFLSSKGWWVLMDAQKEYKRHRGRVVIANMHENILASLSLLGIQDYFEIVPDAVTAIGSF